ncbi:ABC transporter permease [Oleiharenicola lentus]|uniref:ABC transporter permease n=1 Tax=Oleiharenicola lentus TaxID=2508720 RepID=A0A4Q1CAU6_9BACT|nr:ABC transporter permease [Oleiharenicola lentus]RXK56026.1 ABC transporter permease [Oleiharenicola lentus]
MIAETFLQDLRIGFRVLLKEKSFCLLAVFVLTLGICAVTTQFTVVNATVLRGFSFPDSHQLMDVQLVDPTNPNANNFNGRVTALDYEDMKAVQTSFSAMAGYMNGSTVNVTYRGTPQRYTGAYVTEQFFPILGIAPILGRNFTAEDNRPGAERVALISHSLWERDYGRNPDIVGEAVRINGRSATIIGVMPPRFNFPVNEQIWIPLYSEFPVRPRTDQAANNIAIVGRLKPGVSAEQAGAEFTGIAANLALANPETNKDVPAARVQALINNFTGPQLRGLMFVMLAFCLGVLLIACVNVMNMQFARATLRAKELAIRSSLGATRVRLIRQMLTESLLLALIGAILGVAGSYWAVDLLSEAVKALPFPLPYWIVFTIDGRVLAATVGTTMLAAIGSGLIPAWLASRTNASDVLKESGRGNTGRMTNLITRGLVVLQILVTSILLVGSLLQLQSILRQQSINYGYDTGSVYSARLGLFEADYPTPQAKRQFYDRVLRQLRANPEVESAAFSSRFRLTFSGNGNIEIEGRTYAKETDRPLANFENVSDGFFTTLGHRLVEGRDFNAEDDDLKQPVAIVNTAFARKFFNGESPLGRRFRTVGPNNFFGPWRTIVGVAPELRMRAPFNGNNGPAGEEGFYVPLYANIFGPVPAALPAPQFSTIVVRPRGGQPGENAAALTRREMQAIDQNLPLYFAGTPQRLLNETLGQNRIIATMFTIFGVVALILAAVGLYGVTSFSVNQRTQEFGIRMALGADNGSILAMVLRQGLIQLGIGLTLGLGAALTAALLAAAGIQNFLFEVKPHDPLTYATVFALLSTVSLLATFIPARRATRVDPMVALRTE